MALRGLLRTTLVRRLDFKLNIRQVYCILLLVDPACISPHQSCSSKSS